MKSRLRIVQGSSSAGKTIALLLILIDIAQSSKKLISVVSETMPHLKRGAIRDFLNIMQAHNYFKDANWNKTDYVYEFETGSKIEFFSADSQDKVRGPRRDILFINESNNISYETYTQLAIRTNDFIYLDFNPVSEFWVHTELIPTMPHDFDIITYLDNEALPDTVKQELEMRKGNKYFWTVYGLGQIGEIEEKIYKDWQFIDEMPHEARLVRYGLDFGYSNDPTALVAIYEYNGGYILDEVIYQKGLSNKQIADTIQNQLQALVIADSAEPKSIDEIRSYGVNIIASDKGKDSVVNGIQYVQELRISVTKRSLNLIKEYRNYFWIKDKNGKVINEPNAGFNHCFIGETIINTNRGMMPIKDVIVGDKVLTSEGYKSVLSKHNNGIKQVCKYRLQLDTQDDIIVICTPTHKVKIDKGWIPISQLKSGMTVTHIKNLMGKPSNYTQKRDIFQNTIKECIKRFGNITKEIYQKDFMFITKTIIYGIIELKTWILLRVRNICQSTVNKELLLIRNGSNAFGKKGLKQLQNGTEAKREENGTKYTGKNHGLIENIKQRFATCVEKYIKRDMGEYQNIVITTARLKHLGEEGSWKEAVYDLTVEKKHEYFANGILVHNCNDALRYALVSLRNKQTEQANIVAMRNRANMNKWRI